MSEKNKIEEGFTYKNEFARERYGITWEGLKKRIMQNPELITELFDAGYNVKSRKDRRKKMFTPAQKKCIINHLG